MALVRLNPVVSGDLQADGKGLNWLVRGSPKGRRTMAAHELIFHGRQVCVARKPRCGDCPVEGLCPKIGVG